MIEQIALKNIIVEVRHNNNLELNNFSNKIANFSRQYSKEYPASNMDIMNNTLNLINPKKMQSAFFDASRIVVTADHPKNIIDFKTLAGSTIVNSNKIFEIDKFSRIGIRSFWGIQCNSFKEAQDLVANKFIKIQNVLNKFGSNESLFHFGFVSKIDKYTVNFNILTGAEQNVQVNSINPEHTFNNVTNFLILDMDFYIESLVMVGEIADIIIRACDLSTDYSNKFLEYMMEVTGNGDNSEFNASNEVAAAKQ